MKAIDLKQATEEQIEKANQKIANGCKLPFEKVLELVMKNDIYNQPKQMTKKDYEQQKIRNASREMTSVEAQDYFEAQLQNQKRLLI